jgi:hypothetical protein
MSVTVLHNAIDFIKLCGKQVDSEFHLEGEMIGNYEKLFVYLFQPARCEQFGLNHNKGLYIYGSPGAGKSFAFKVMKQMILFASDNGMLDISERFPIIPFIEIQRQYKKESEEIFELYGRGCKKTLGIDEMFHDISYTGSGYGGKKIDLSAELITDRHLLFTEEKIKTHLTSNIHIAGVQSLLENDGSKRFDDRTVRRLDEMFTELWWKGGDQTK